MASPVSPHSATMIEILKNCPRGRLNYERQSSFTPTKQEKSSNLFSQILEKTSPSLGSGDQKNVTTPMAGSMADVSSVVEDVSTEMYDLQVQRLASVIQKIKENQEKARIHEETNSSSDESDSDNGEDLKYVWISPLVELEEKKQESPKFAKNQPKIAMPKMSNLQLSPKIHLNSIVNQEIEKLENERKLEVEAKVNERRKRFSIDHEHISRKSNLNLELSLKKIQSNIALQLDKEREAESNHATRQQNYDSSKEKEEIAARQAREAMIESHLQKVKQMEAAKLEKKRILQEQINPLVTNLSQNFQQILATMDRQHLDLALKTYRMTIEEFPTYLQNMLNMQNPT